jgi:HD-GYP domain-containing protein (c-di-GMP phosphodiesterase class II)
MTAPASWRPRVVVVDGHAVRGAEMVAMLQPFYRTGLYHDGRAALEDMAGSPCAAIIIDEMVPPMGGPALVRQLRSDAKLHGIGAICLSTGGGAIAEATARAAGADGLLNRPVARRALLAVVSPLCSRAVEAAWEQLPPVDRVALRSTVDAFNGISDDIDHGRPLDLAAVDDACTNLVAAVQDRSYRTILDGVREHDNYSYVHSLRVATFLSVFGQAIGLKGDDLLVLASGGLVHDIGKMSIPLDVLNKPGRLEEAEWAVMRSHVDRSMVVLRRQPQVPRGVMVIAAQHHEKLDGSGYPKGLGGAQLNDLARMASIVDVFGALTDRRVYKPPMAPEQALDLMAGDMAPGLDQNLLGRFRAMLLDAAHRPTAAA